MRFVRLLPLYLFFFVASVQAQSANSGTDSVRTFVQSFYDWYVPQATAVASEPAWTRALKAKSDLFDPALSKALQRDAAAQARVQEIIGLDSDPFLNAQDPAAHYRVVAIEPHGAGYEVTVQGASTGTTAKTMLIAVVASENGQLRFVNFRYPAEHTDLIKLLAALRRNRRTH